MVQIVNDRPQTLLAAARYYSTERATAYIASIKWPDGPCCPKCGSVNVGTIASRGKFQCREKGCRKQFSLITGTIMESSHLRLDQWILAVWMIANCRNGVSSCEIARTVGCKQQSAWHLLHRVRHLFTQDRREPMSGIVEVDETLVGGRYEFMHAARRERAMMEGSRYGKTLVMGMLERRTGQVRAGVISDATVKIAKYEISGNIQPGTEIHTDGAAIYGWVKNGYVHRSVNHRAGQY